MKTQLFRADFHPSFKYVGSEPAAANYYPVTNRVFINDAKDQLTVLTDRAEGATSRNGYIELMVGWLTFVNVAKAS